MPFPHSSSTPLSGRCILLWSLMVPAGPALAQDAAEPFVLEEIVLVTSASSIATSVQDAPASVTVIDAEANLASGARDLDDVLRTVPGLNLTRSNDGNADVSFRGLSSSRTLTLVDGKRINTRNTFARHYQGDLQIVPLDAIERIEVVRGPMSTLYGSDAMGGVINIITKKATEAWTGSVTTDFGLADANTTADSRALSAYLSGPLGPRLSLSAWAKLAETEAPEEPYGFATLRGVETPLYASNGLRTRTLGTRLTWAPHDAVEWGIEAQGSKDDYLAADGGPDENKVSKYSLALTNDMQTGTGQVSSYLRHERSANQSRNSDTLSWNSAINYDTTTIGSRWTDRAVLAGREVDHTVGGLLAHEALSDPSTTAGTVIEGSATTGALYAEGRLHATAALSVTGGLRLDHHEDFGSHLTPRLYANYKISDRLMLKAGYSQAFVAPDLRNLNPNYQIASRGNGCKPYQGPCAVIGNPDLQPETSDNFEIGLNYQGTRTSWELTAFHNDVENMISARRTGNTTADGTPIFQRDNFDQGRTTGIEAGADTALTDALTWTTAVTHIAKSEFSYGAFDTTYPMATTPEWNVTTGLAWQATSRLTLSGQVTYVGRQAGYVVEEGLVVGDGEQASVPAGQNSDPYHLVGLSAAYDLTDSTTLNLGIDNLLDEQPEADVDYREDGRLFKIGLTSRF